MARGGGKFGWFLGIVMGTLFGVLFAPRKGKDLRDKIKDDRKKGKLGIAPLKTDLKHLGKQLADMAKEIYSSESVKEIIEKGRTRVKDLSDDLVEEVTDFHKRRIEPLVDEVQSNLKKSDKEYKQVKRKVKAATKVGQKAVREVKRIIKKKPE